MNNLIRAIYTLAILAQDRNNLKLATVLFGDYEFYFDGEKIPTRVVETLCRQFNMEICVI